MIQELVGFSEPDAYTATAENNYFAMLHPCGLILTLLHGASLRGPHALLDSPLPSLPVHRTVTYHMGSFPKLPLAYFSCFGSGKPIEGVGVYTEANNT